MVLWSQAPGTQFLHRTKKRTNLTSSEGPQGIWTTQSSGQSIGINDGKNGVYAGGYRKITQRTVPSTAQYYFLLDLGETFLFGLDLCPFHQPLLV
jgi:hypothetical protein